MRNNGGIKVKRTTRSAKNCKKRSKEIKCNRSDWKRENGLWFHKNSNGEWEVQK